MLNRVRSGIYPTTVCGVVYQDRERPFACQFSFACEGKSLRVEEPACWATATRIAEGVVKGTIYEPKFASAINYHAAYVRPFWASTLKGSTGSACIFSTLCGPASTGRPARSTATATCRRRWPQRGPAQTTVKA